MILKELETSHLSISSVNLTNVFKIIAKYRRKIISKYRQKLLFIASWGPTIMFIIFWDILMFDQISFPLNFPINVLFPMKTRVCPKYFVNDCSLRVNSSRRWALFKSPLIRYIFYLLRKVKRSAIQIYDDVCLKMPCTRFDTPCLQLVQQSYTKSELLVIMRLLESNMA